MEGAESMKNDRVSSPLFWLPRAIAILFALFLSIFALDVFAEHLGFAKTALALLIHLIPTFVVLACLVLAWRREWFGVGANILLGILYIVIAWGRFHWSAYLVIAGPLFLIGLLFLVEWIYERRVSSV